MSSNEARIEHRGIADREHLRPEQVMSTLAKRTKAFEQLRRPQRRQVFGWTAQHANESVFGQRTSRPSMRTMVGKPVVRQFVMNMIRTEERHQNVDVQ